MNKKLKLEDVFDVVEWEYKSIKNGEVLSSEMRKKLRFEGNEIYCSGKINCQRIEYWLNLDFTDEELELLFDKVTIFIKDFMIKDELYDDGFTEDECYMILEWIESGEVNLRRLMYILEKYDDYYYDIFAYDDWCEMEGRLDEEYPLFIKLVAGFYEVYLRNN